MLWACNEQSNSICKVTNDKVFKDFGMINIKYVQTSFQAFMTWPKNSSTLKILILTLLTFITLVKTQFATKVEQCLTYRTIIIMCYNCQTKALANWIPSKQTWIIVKAICDALFLIMFACVLKQHCGYLLLLNALAIAIKLYVQLSKDMLDLFFLDFMDFFKLFKAHNMLTSFMLDPWFKNLNLVGDYVDHLLAIE